MSTKINRDTAELEFMRICEGWNLDCNEEEFNEEEKKSFIALKDKIVKAIMKGNLVFTDENKIEYYFLNPAKARGLEKIELSEPDGGAYAAMDKYKENEFQHKIFSALAGMSGKEVAFFKGVSGSDVKILQAVVSLFLSS